MTIAQSFLPEFDHEMANTRKTLDRLPDDKFAWKPHEKSMSIGQLANHLAHIPSWGIPTIELPELDLAPVGGEAFESPTADTRAQILEMYDDSVKKFRALLETVTDAALMENWTLKSGGQPFFTMPRIAVVRSMIFNHMIHHRAQLGVFYRLNDIPVPAIYGPSADEK